MKARATIVVDYDIPDYVWEGTDKEIEEQEAIAITEMINLEVFSPEPELRRLEIKILEPVVQIAGQVDIDGNVSS